MHRQSILLIVLTLLVTASAKAQFAFTFGSSGQEYGKAITVDSNDNPIVAALFQNTVNVDPNGSLLLQSTGGVDVAIAKYSSSGSVVWAMRFGGATTTDVPHGVAVDDSDNVYVTGYFGSQQDTNPHSANFNPNGGGTIATKSDFDVFLAKYDASGNYRWALGLGNSAGATEERAWDIAVDERGYVYIAGAMHGTVDFNPRGTPNICQISSPDAGLFLAKYNPDGINQWAIVIDARDTSVFTEAYAAVSVHADGSVYLAGNFRGTNVNFNPLGLATLSSAGQTDMFLARYDTAGTFSWVKRIGGTAQDIVSPGAMRVDHAGHPTFTGRISGTVNFNTSGGVNNVSGASLFLASYSDAGALRLAFGMPSNAGDGGHRVAFDAQDNMFVAGWMNGTVDFDPNGTHNITAVAPTADAFLAKYTGAGTLLWAFSAGATNSSQNNICAGLVIDSHGSAIITGQLYGTNADFDPSPTGQCSLSSVGLNDCFVAKYDANGTFFPVEVDLFSASLLNDIVLLSWRTAGETSSHGFEVQRQVATGTTWAPIGFVPGAGTTSEARTYQFADGLHDLPSPVTTVHYRLRMIDTDGSYVHSPEVEVRLEVMPVSLTLSAPYPNPATDRITVPFTLASDASVRISLYDMSGALIRVATQGNLHDRGTHAVVVHTAGLSSGTYMLELFAGGERRTAIVGIVQGR
jgi:hypothetical protein